MPRCLSVSSLVYSSLVSCVPAPDPSQWLPAGNLGRLSGGTPRRPWWQRDLNPRLVRPARTRAAYATHVPREPGPKFHPISRTIPYLIHPHPPPSTHPAHFVQLPRSLYHDHCRSSTILALKTSYVLLVKKFYCSWMKIHLFDVASSQLVSTVHVK